MGELTPITERIDNYLNEYRKRIEQYYKDIEQYYKDHEIYRKTDYEVLQILDRIDIDNRELPQTLKEEMLAVEDETVSKYVLDVLNDFSRFRERERVCVCVCMCVRVYVCTCSRHVGGLVMMTIEEQS